jgi:hypothetical protein
VKKLLAPLVTLSIALGTVGVYLTAFYAGEAHAQSVDAGVGSGSSVLPSDQLHDPLSNPVQSYDDLLAAKHLGWPVLAFALVLMLARVAGTLGKNISWLAVLGQGKVAVVVAGLAAVSASAYNTAFSGGSLVAVLTAAVLALATYWDSASKAQPSA